MILNESIDDTIAKVSYCLLPRYHAGTPQQFVLDTIAALDQHNALDVATKHDECNPMLVNLVQRVEPFDLKQLVKDDVGMWNAD